MISRLLVRQVKALRKGLQLLGSDIKLSKAAIKELEKLQHVMAEVFISNI